LAAAAAVASTTVVAVAVVSVAARSAATTAAITANVAKPSVARCMLAVLCSLSCLLIKTLSDCLIVLSISKVNVCH